MRLVGCIFDDADSSQRLTVGSDAPKTFWLCQYDTAYTMRSTRHLAINHVDRLISWLGICIGLRGLSIRPALNIRSRDKRERGSRSRPSALL